MHKVTRTNKVFYCYSKYRKLPWSEFNKLESNAKSWWGNISSLTRNSTCKFLLKGLHFAHGILLSKGKRDRTLMAPIYFKGNWRTNCWDVIFKKICPKQSLFVVYLNSSKLSGKSLRRLGTLYVWRFDYNWNFAWSSDFPRAIRTFVYVRGLQTRSCRV